MADIPLIFDAFEKFDIFGSTLRTGKWMALDIWASFFRYDQPAFDAPETPEQVFVKGMITTLAGEHKNCYNNANTIIALKSFFNAIRHSL